MNENTEATEPDLPPTATPSKKTVVKRQRVRPMIGRQRDVMPTVKLPKGYTGRWFNDVNDRIYQQTRHGWDFLAVSGEVKQGDQGVKNAKQSGELYRKNVGGGVEAFLMVIKKEWYAEDRKAYHDTVKLSKMNIDKEAKNTPGVYGGIKVTEKMGT